MGSRETGDFKKRGEEGVRLIDADDMLERSRNERFMWVYDLTDLEEFLTHVPTIEAVPVVHGEWIDLRESSKDVPSCKCSACGHVHFGLETNFCPNCGAKMRTE